MSDQEFDKRVRELIEGGIEPRCIYRAKKSECTPEEWAAHRVYYQEYSRRPSVKAARRVYDARWLSKKGVAKA
jgi:hypothetical protein